MFDLENLEAKLDKLVENYKKLNSKLSDPEVINDSDKYQKLLKKHAKLKKIVEKYNEYKEAKEGIEEAEEMMELDDDPEMQALYEEEIAELKPKKEKLQEKLPIMLLPDDPNDEKNVIVEIRAGAGGDEAGLFAADLYRMYTRYAEGKGWKVEIMSVNESGTGGFKEIIFTIEGTDIFKYLKYESGVHRVQRVPSTESSGRIHTSTATVAVLPEAEEVDVEINTNELTIDTFRSSGPGGQSVNTTDSAIRITHNPTGLTVSCQDEKSQHKNKAKAMRILRARLQEKKEQEKQKERAEARKSQVGTGDRSEKIRTYNFPQGRVSDHRINLTLHQLDKILDGDMDSVIEALIEEDNVLQEIGEDLIMNIKELLNRSDQFLAERGVESSRLDAEVLMADLLDMERINLYVKYDYPLKSNEINTYREMIKKRAQRIPVAYITEKKEFMSLEFKVEAGVLIPRPDTENLVETVIEYCSQNELDSPQIIDVGTGSGAIAVSLAHYIKDAKVVGVDLSARALKVARHNMEKHELSERMSILKSDLLKEFIKREINGIDIIVSNPPYISEAEMKELSPEVKKEPKTALEAGEDGLDYYRRLIPEAEKVLKNNGKIFLEIGYQQAEAVSNLFGGNWSEVEVQKDYSENDRIVSAVFRAVKETESEAD